MITMVLAMLWFLTSVFASILYPGILNPTNVSKFASCKENMSGLCLPIIYNISSILLEKFELPLLKCNIFKLPFFEILPLSECTDLLFDLARYVK